MPMLRTWDRHITTTITMNIKSSVTLIHIDARSVRAVLSLGHNLRLCCKKKPICSSGENEQARTLSFISHQSQNPFTWCHFQSDIILLCVRSYLRYSLSYRDLEEMIREPGLHIGHST